MRLSLGCVSKWEYLQKTHRTCDKCCFEMIDKNYPCIEFTPYSSHVMAVAAAAVHHTLTACKATQVERVITSPGPKFVIQCWVDQLGATKAGRSNLTEVEEEEEEIITTEISLQHNPASSSSGSSPPPTLKYITCHSVTCLTECMSTRKAIRFQFW